MASLSELSQKVGEGFNVQLPDFTRNNFATSVSRQSSRVYLRLVHNPYLAAHLPLGSATGNLIQTSAAELLVEDRWNQPNDRLRRTVEKRGSSARWGGGGDKSRSNGVSSLSCEKGMAALREVLEFLENYYTEEKEEQEMEIREKDYHVYNANNSATSERTAKEGEEKQSPTTKEDPTVSEPGSSGGKNDGEDDELVGTGSRTMPPSRAMSDHITTENLKSSFLHQKQNANHHHPVKRQRAHSCIIEMDKRSKEIKNSHSFTDLNSKFGYYLDKNEKHYPVNNLIFESFIGFRNRGRVEKRAGSGAPAEEEGEISRDSIFDENPPVLSEPPPKSTTADLPPPNKPRLVHPNAVPPRPRKNNDDLAGWLFLLVWERHFICMLLQELSSLQGTLAWCAMYWSWAQEHTRQAAWHRGLSSLSFWREFYTKGLFLTEMETRYMAMDRMRQLKSLFKLIVSSIGAAHTILSRLTATVSQIYRHCELQTSPQALAAAVATSNTEGPPNAIHTNTGTRYTSGEESPAVGSPLKSAKTAPEGSSPRPPLYPAPTNPRDPVEELREAVVTAAAQMSSLLHTCDVLDLPQQRDDDKSMLQLWYESTAPYEMFNIVADGETGSPTVWSSAAVPPSTELTLEYGVRTLLEAVGASQKFSRQVEDQLTNGGYRPPIARFWLRMVVAAAITVPPFVWLYRKTPSELESLARSAASYTKHLLRTYLWMPLKQLQESLWYERPGVEDRRNSLTRDAESLSNIIRDYHEDYYPSMAQSKLDDVRDNTFHALKDGVADAGGYALVAEHYRKAVKYPVWNTVFGNLPRIILIQMSLQSLEMSRVTNGIDEVLEGNDLNFKVMAMAPVVMCGSVLALWARRRWGASRHPIERRMKLYWRLVYRVVSYAGTYNAATVNPYSGNYYHYHHYAGGGAATNSNHNNFVNLAKSYNLQRMHSWQLPNVLSGNNLDSAENWINHNNSNHLLGQSVNFSNNNNNMNANSIPVNYQSTPPRSLNNYEKGMLLLLVHIMRCTAEEYLSHYLFYRELIEDLEDLEGMQGDRQVRLETLQRMHVTHRFFQ